MLFTPLKTIVDVSLYQDNNATPQGIDFVKMKTRTDEVIIRAGQRYWIDPDVAVNWANAKAAGLLRGSYWFYDSRETPQAQAALWKQVIGNDLPERGLWVDLEEAYGGAYAGEANWKNFVEAVKLQFPNTLVGVYTGNWWWSLQVVSQTAYWQALPLWMASYTSVETAIVPAPWRTKGAVLWQYSSKGDGLLYGVESLSIDLNYTSQAWNDLFNVVVPPVEKKITDVNIKLASGSVVTTMYSDGTSEIKTA